eukprot:TRINITY_DN10701_c0_g1_i1.p1 TRINITY_DN10701_c0_g1~~TRINITY_DN10701_c0_g1_i1.p1  ORF type:complete len:256 (+),score=50.47 TRINITY_DN10701_c0_g1_i1:34-768(+)
MSKSFASSPHLGNDQEHCVTQEVKDASNATNLPQTMEEYARCLTSQAFQSAVVMSLHGFDVAGTGESMHVSDGWNNNTEQVLGHVGSADKQHDGDLLHLVGWTTSTGVLEEGGEHEVDVLTEGEEYRGAQGEAEAEGSGEPDAAGHGIDNTNMNANAEAPPRLRLRAPREAFFNDEVRTSDGSIRWLGRISKDKYTLPSRKKRTEHEKFVESLKSSLSEVKARLETSPVQFRPDLSRIPCISEE